MVNFGERCRDVCCAACSRPGADDLLGGAFAGAHGAFHQSVHLLGIFSRGKVNTARGLAQRFSVGGARFARSERSCQP
jgi:hypothetical protein